MQGKDPGGRLPAKLCFNPRSDCVDYGTSVFFLKKRHIQHSSHYKSSIAVVSTS